MKRKTWFVVGIIGMMLLLLACGGGGKATTPPTAAPQSSGGASSGGGTSSGGGKTSGGGTSSGGFNITVVNNTGREICYVMISSSDETAWGEDELGEDEKIADGASRTFKVDAGTYDVNIEDCDQTVLATAWGLSQDTTVTAGRKNAVRLMFVNNSSKEVCYFFISPSTNDNWGDDWLGDKESVMPGNSRIFFVDPGTYDLMAGDCDGETTISEKDNVELNSDMTWTISDSN